jgi:hypothetical protein
MLRFFTESIQQLKSQTASPQSRFQKSSYGDVAHNRETETRLLALNRSILQSITLSAFEAQLAFGDANPTGIRGLASLLLYPNDSAYAAVLDSMQPFLASEGITSFRRDNWAPLRQRLNHWAKLRNDFAHDVIAGDVLPQRIDFQLALAESLLSHCGQLLPNPTAKKSLVLEFTKRRKLDLTLTQWIDDAPGYVRQFRRSGSQWTAHGSLLNFQRSGRFERPLPSGNALDRVLGDSCEEFIEHRIADGSGEFRSLLTNLPIRQTEDFFGRHEELQNLRDWYYCETRPNYTLFGQGGVGKTTTALEGFNDILERPQEGWSHPSAIVFHSTKSMYWGPSGNRHETVDTSLVAALARAVRALAPTFEEKVWQAAMPARLGAKAPENEPEARCRA